MTVSTTTSRADYTGNGVTTAFTVPFYFLDNSHVLVLRTQISTGVTTTLALTTDYTVSGAGVSSGGTVTAVVAPTSDQKLSILRNVPFTQLTHYVENDPFPAASHERALDQLTMEVQQLNEVQSRALTFSKATTGVSASLPNPAANNFLAWNAAGNAFQNVSPSDIVQIAGASGFTTQLFSGNGSTVSFTLSANPGTNSNLEVFISGVRQTPTVDYSFSGTLLTFVAAPPSGSSNVFVRWGQTLGVGVPSDTSVTTAKLGDASVTTPKIADGAVTTPKMSTTGVAPGSYSAANITVDAAGRVTAASNGAAGGGMTLLATVTPANGATSASATGLTSSKQLVVVGAGFTLSASDSLTLKLSVDNGATFPGIAVSMSNNSVSPITAAVNFYNTAINAAKRGTAVVPGSTNIYAETNSTINAGVVNAIQLYPQNGAGTFTGAGTIYIYGVN